MRRGGRPPAPPVRVVVAALAATSLLGCATGGDEAADTTVPPSVTAGTPSSDPAAGDGSTAEGADPSDAPGTASPTTGDEAAPTSPPGWLEAGRFDAALGTEVSGLAAGRVVDGLWLVDDEPGTREVHLLALDGTLRATVRMEGADTANPEDLAVGPCHDDPGTACVHVADIGDNVRARTEVVVLSVPEAVAADGGVVDAPPTVRRLRYADGPRDAEALVVTGDGAVVVLDKTEDVTGVHVALPGEDVLRRVADWPLPPPPSPGLATIVGHTVTAADVAADGSFLAVRTYDQVLLLRPPAGTVVDGSSIAQLADWAVTELPGPPTELQGEAIAVLDDGRLASAAEGSTRISVTSAAVPGG